MATDTKVVPLVGSGMAGPLGALHLPRLWAKLTLHHAGALADGYDACGHGFDQLTISNLGLDRDKVVAFIKDHKPTYMQFEKWVTDENGGSIPQEKIDAHNAMVAGYNHADDKGADMRAASGIGDHSIKDAVSLNAIEDLDELHKQMAVR